MTFASDDLMVIPFGPAPIRVTCLASSPFFRFHVSGTLQGRDDIVSSVDVPSVGGLRYRISSKDDGGGH